MWPLQYCEEMSFMLSSQKCVVHGHCGLCATECPTGCAPPTKAQGGSSVFCFFICSLVKRPVQERYQTVTGVFQLQKVPNFIDFF